MAKLFKFNNRDNKVIHRGYVMVGECVHRQARLNKLILLIIKLSFLKPFKIYVLD